MSDSNGLMTLEDWTTPDARRYKVCEIGDKRVKIRSLHAGDVADCDAPNFRTDGKVSIDKAKDTKLRYIVASVVNDNNEPYLTFAHCSAMRRKDSQFIGALYEEIAEFSGLSKDSVEDHEKNSEPTADADSQ